MYVDETGGTEPTVTSNEEMTVTVDGTEYATEMNIDLDHDGTPDAAVVNNADGSKSVYVDTDGDRVADEYAEVSATGELVAEARFDETTGEWGAVDPSLSGPAPEPTDGAEPAPAPEPADETSTVGGGVLKAELPDGQEVEVGTPTIDTNSDGVNDTAVSEDQAGNTYYFTDVDNDGEADYVVIVGQDGSTQALEHQGGGQWTKVDGVDGTPGGAPADTGGPSGFTEGVVKIDANTGLWVNMN